MVQVFIDLEEMTLFFHTTQLYYDHVYQKWIEETNDHDIKIVRELIDDLPTDIRTKIEEKIKK